METETSDDVTQLKQSTDRMAKKFVDIEHAGNGMEVLLEQTEEEISSMKDDMLEKDMVIREKNEESVEMRSRFQQEIHEKDNQLETLQQRVKEGLEEKRQLREALISARKHRDEIERLWRAREEENRRLNEEVVNNFLLVAERDNELVQMRHGHELQLVRRIKEVENLKLSCRELEKEKKRLEQLLEMIYAGGNIPLRRKEKKSSERNRGEEDLRREVKRLPKEASEEKVSLLNEEEEEKLKKADSHRKNSKDREDALLQIEKQQLEELFQEQMDRALEELDSMERSEAEGELVALPHMEKEPWPNCSSCQFGWKIAFRRQWEAVCYLVIGGISVDG